jgi:hypothetical protein
VCDLIVIRYKLIQKKNKKNGLYYLLILILINLIIFLNLKKIKLTIYYNNGIFALNNIKKINT